jgi:hypothetical protein
MDHSSSGLPRKIPFHLLQEITDRFSYERKLGSGAYGKVYMVRLLKKEVMIQLGERVTTSSMTHNLHII